MTRKPTREPREYKDKTRDKASAAAKIQRARKAKKQRRAYERGEWK